LFSTNKKKSNLNRSASLIETNETYINCKPISLKNKTKLSRNKNFSYYITHKVNTSYKTTNKNENFSSNKNKHLKIFDTNNLVVNLFTNRLQTKNNCNSYIKFYLNKKLNNIQNNNNYFSKQKLYESKNEGNIISPNKNSYKYIKQLNMNKIHPSHNYNSLQNVQTFRKTTRNPSNDNKEVKIFDGILSNKNNDKNNGKTTSSFKPKQKNKIFEKIATKVKDIHKKEDLSNQIKTMLYDNIKDSQGEDEIEYPEYDDDYRYSEYTFKNNIKEDNDTPKFKEKNEKNKKINMKLMNKININNINKNNIKFCWNNYFLK
jgi:hypothetical protein